MRDIAQLAQVSTATISRVLHDSPLVDPITAQRVRDVIHRNNYVPNSTGTALKSGRSGIFGLIVPSIDNPFFADFIQHFERQVLARNQEMMLATTGHLPAQMQRSTRRMLTRGVEGLVILESEVETEAYETMLRNHVPIVTLNRMLVEHGVSDVAVQARKGMTEALRHLISLGHRRIGFLGGRPGQSISHERERSFRDALRKLHLPLHEEHIVAANFSFEGGRTAMAGLLAQQNRVTAVLCANDLSAIGAMAAIREAGLTTGQDISVIGLDDIDLCTMVHPQLTTLRLSRERLVELYLQALTGLTHSPNTPGQQLMIELEFVERDSTGPRR